MSVCQIRFLLVASGKLTVLSPLVYLPLSPSQAVCFYFLPAHPPTCGGERGGPVPTLVVPPCQCWSVVAQQPCAEIMSDYGGRWPALLVAATVRYATVSSVDGRERSKPDRGLDGSCSGQGERCISHELLPRDVCLPDLLFACC